MMNDKFVKPSGFKYSTMPNMWELCKFLAVVLHVSGKPNPWDNRKTFDRCGYMPLYGGKDGFCAVDVVKEIIRKAQSKEKLSVYPDGGIDSYEKLAQSFVDKYVSFVKGFKPETGISPGLDSIRHFCTDLVVWYLGGQFRSRCEEQYDKMFGGTLFSDDDYAELLNKDVKKWGDREKALAFSVPFYGRDLETRTKMYGDIFELITRYAERLGNNGSKHTNLWIDQYTELGYSFGWHTDSTLNDGVKQVLRCQPMDESDKKEIERTMNRWVPQGIQDQLKIVVESLSTPSEPNEFMMMMTNRKGVHAVFSNVMMKAMNTAPKDAVNQIPDDWNKQLIDITDRIESPDDPDVKNFFNLIADHLGVLGGTGDKVKDFLMQYMPKVREMLNDPDTVEPVGSILRQFAEIVGDYQKNMKKN